MSAEVAMDSDSDSSEDKDFDPTKVKKKKSKKNQFLDDAAEVSGSDDTDGDDDVSDEGSDDSIINDEEIEEDDDDQIGRKRERTSDGEKELDEDDRNLLRENLGDEAAGLLEKKKFKRLKPNKSIDSDDDEFDTKEALAEQLFSNSGDEDEGKQKPTKNDFEAMTESEGSEGSDEDDMGNFIEDDGPGDVQQKKKKKKKKKGKTIRSATTREALDIFGPAYFTSGLAEEEFDDDIQDEDGYYDDGEEYSKPKKSTDLKDTYRFEDLEDQYLTERDKRIADTDLPERVQLDFGNFEGRKVGDIDEYRQEATWIFNNGFTNDNQYFCSTDPILQKIRNSDNRNKEECIDAITETVSLLRWEDDIEYDRTGGETENEEAKVKLDFSGPRDIPFIAQYRKEKVKYPEVLNMHDLWTIKKCDLTWHKLQLRKSRLEKAYKRVQNYHYGMFKSLLDCAKKAENLSASEIKSACKYDVPGAADFERIHPKAFAQVVAGKVTMTEDVETNAIKIEGADGVNFVESYHFENIKNAMTEEEVADEADYFRLYFGDDSELALSEQDGLIKWANEKVQSVEISNMHQSWRDGIAFCGLVASAAECKQISVPEGLSDDKDPSRPLDNLREAKEQAKTLLGIELNYDPVTFIRCTNEYRRFKQDASYTNEAEFNAKALRICEKPDDEIVERVVRQIRQVFVEVDPSHGFPGRDKKSGKDQAKRRIGGRRDLFGRCRRAGIGMLVDSFGLDAMQVGENVENMGNLHAPENSNKFPEELAEEFLCPEFNDVERVLRGAKFFYAMQLSRNDTIIKHVRKIFKREVEITVKPTPRGQQTIEDWNPLARYRYLKRKKVASLQNADFLWIHQGAKAELVTYKLDVCPENDMSLFLDLERLVGDESIDDTAVQWADLRKSALQYAILDILKPRFLKKLETDLLEEAFDHVVEQCANYVRSNINRAPYVSTAPKDEDVEEELGLHLLSINLGDDRDIPSYAVVLDGSGEVVEYARLKFLCLRKNSNREGDSRRRENDWKELKQLITSQNISPELVVLGACKNADRFKQDLEELLGEISQETDEALTPVEYGDLALPQAYGRSNISEKQFPDLPKELRVAIMLGRQIQAPELAYACMVNRDKDILNIRMHPLQDMIPERILVEALEEEVTTVVNKLGMNVNHALHGRLAVGGTFPFLASGLPFISGLGPRKAYSLMRQINKEVLYSRWQLLESNLGSDCAVGPVVARMCVGFFLIIGQEVDESLHPNALDKTRVHPVDYALAAKIAMDAVEIVPNQDTEDPLSYNADKEEGAKAVEDLLSSPEKLANMHLDEFADQLRDKGFGEKRKTIHDIRAEFEHPFRDTRLEYVPMGVVQLFQSMTGETVHTCKVPDTVERDRVMEDDEGLMVCPVGAKLNEYDEIELLEHGEGELFFHSHIEEAPSLVLGQLVEATVRRFKYKEPEENESMMQPDEDPQRIATMVHVSLANNLQGTIHYRELSDKHIESADERVQPGMSITARVQRIKLKYKSVQLSCKGSELRGKAIEFESGCGAYYNGGPCICGDKRCKGNRYSPAAWGWDPDYDIESYEQDLSALEEKTNKIKKQYNRRAVDHMLFRHFNYGMTENHMKKSNFGEIVIRPSSKGTDHLTVSWKLTDEITVHIDIEEQDKDPNAPNAVGNRLIIRNEAYESLDEIVASYVVPTIDFCRMLIAQPCYRNKTKLDVIEELKNEKSTQPNRIPYFISHLKDFPGKFLLSYMPNQRPKHEVVSVRPEGYRFREKMFTSPNELVSWFKRHYRDFIPAPRDVQRYRPDPYAPRG
eukprot:m.107521 g.107521  ORF g.107521 m.107521 type:complete len:1792 (+) comp13933_c0_seq1:186-5561(+)